MAEEIGSMIVRLQGDTKQYQQSLKAAESQAASSANAITNNLKKAEDATKDLAVPAKSLGEQYALTASKLGAVGIAIGSIAKLGALFANAEAEAFRFNLQLQRSAKLAQEALDVNARRFEERRSIVEATGNPAERRAGLEKELANTQRDLERATEELRRAAENYDVTANNFIDNLGRSVPFFGRKRQQDLDARKNALDEYTKKFDTLRTRARDLKTDLERATTPEESPAVLIALNQTTAALRKQLETFGLTSEEIAVYELRLQGATNAQLKQVETLQKSIKARQREIENFNEVNAMLAANEQAYAAQATSIEQGVLTPLEKYRQTIDNLNDQLLNGVLKQDAFERATAAAAKELEDAIVPVKDLNQQLERLEGATSRSAEAASRVRGFQNLIGGQLRQIQATPGARLERAQDRQVLDRLRVNDPTNPAFQGEQGKRQAELLKDIRDILKAQKQRNDNRPAAEPAGL